MKRASLTCLPFLACLAVTSTAGAEPPAIAEAPPLDVHRAPLPKEELDYHQPEISPTFAWLLFQLLPSPELAFGRQRAIDVNGSVDRGISTAFGLRWQLTPVLWSFGVHRKQSRWRYFVVDPFARHSGSIELSTTFEYIGGEISGLIARPGIRVYLPVVDKGEYLSVSLGTSTYRYDGYRVAYDVGAYVLSGLVGLQLTTAPAHAPLTAIATLRLKYF